MASGEVVSNADISTRINTSRLNADSSTYTTEVSILTVTGLVTAGQTYSITAHARPGYSSGTLATGATGETIQLRIREDSVSGTQLNMVQYPLMTQSGNGHTCWVYGEYTAVSTVSKTFALTAQRGVGTATHIVRAVASAPAFLYLDLLPN